MRPRQEEQLAKYKMEARAAASAGDAKAWRRPSAAEGSSACLLTSWSVDLAFSAPMGMGPGPKHVGTLTLEAPPRGHPA